MLFNLFLSFFKIGAFTFGGGYAMLPLIQRDIIDKFHWLTESEFLDIVATAEMTPGPIAINAATFVGYKLSGIWGSALATLAIVLPSFLAITLLTVFLNRLKGNPHAENGIKGMRPAVTAMILAAALSLAPQSIVRPLDIILFIGSCFLAWKKLTNPILILVFSGLISLVISLF